jgi:hypothetical protein
MTLAAALSTALETFDGASAALNRSMDELVGSATQLRYANERLIDRLRTAAIMHIDTLDFPALVVTTAGIERVNHAFAKALGCVPEDYEGRAWEAPRAADAPTPESWVARDGSIHTYSWRVVELNGGQFFCYAVPPALPPG